MSRIHASVLRRATAFAFFLLIFSFTSIIAAAQRAATASSTSAKGANLSDRKDRDAGKRSRVRYSAAANRKAQNGKTVVPQMQYLGVSDSLAYLATLPQPEVSKENGPLNEIRNEELYEEPTPKLSGNVAPDPLQTIPGPSFSAVTGTTFDAISANGSAPPDTTMAVGPNHIVVWVNSQYAVYNKSGVLLTGPVNGNTLFTGVGGLCETTNRGDPILQYDRLSDRWILSQFAFNLSGPNPAAPYMQCFAVSTTNNPTGTYFRYSVTFSSTSPSGFNDYGKLGIWPDAYYTSYNMFGGSPAGSNTGVALCASDRTKMLAGDATATTLCAPIAFYAGGGAFLPADLDGTTAPSTLAQGGIFIRQSTAPALRLLKLKPDFVGGTVTLTNGFGGAAGSFIDIPLTATTRACNGSGGTCVAQPGTANTLDTLGDRLMYRAAFRNREGLENLLVAQSVDPDGAGARSSAVRWYEIRNPLSATPTLYQNSTFDGSGSGDRWMGSIAMNKDGDMMMGYSIVNSVAALKPSIALTGRRLSDTVNTMQTESIVFTGSGSQTGTLTRWGDYTTIQTDPTDDQGFCFIGQYLPADGTFNWKTRVICAKFPTVTAAPVSVSGQVIGTSGYGVANAIVSITDGNGFSRSVRTNPFGYFNIDGVTVGQTYIMTAQAKGYRFPSRTLSIDDNISDLEFVAQL